MNEDLVCHDCGAEFDSSDIDDSQQSDGDPTCPECGSEDVGSA